MGLSFVVDKFDSYEMSDLKFWTLDVSVGNMRRCQLRYKALDVLKNKQTLKVPIIGSSQKKLYPFLFFKFLLFFPEFSQ